MKKNACLIFLPFLLFLNLSARADESSQHQKKTLPAVHFMSKEESRHALSDGKASQYYQSLYLNEMRAKTGLSLDKTTLSQAREAARKFYADGTLDFSGEETAAIQDVLAQLYPKLKEKAPAYSKSPWCFIKIDAHIEGGLPHTRGDCIVLSSSVLDEFSALETQKRTAELYKAAANLLVHEQTHVLQRHHPDRFNFLYTEKLGFVHMTPAPANRWLLENGVVNPDAPDSGWAFPVYDNEGPRWVMPYLVLKPSPKPIMPEDFIVLGVTMKQANGAWEPVDASPASIKQLLTDFYAYAGQFPNPDQAYHPNELTADILAAWIAESEGFNLKHPISVAVLAWAKTGLQ